MVQGEYMENLLSIKKKSFFPGLTLLLAGFLAGMLIPNFIYRFSWKQQAFSAVYLLETYGKTEAGGIDYLLQILWMRGGIFFLSLICGFTVFGVPMAIMAMFFTGIGLGIVFSMSILQFGLTGGAVAVALLFPHYLIYLGMLYYLAAEARKVGEDKNKKRMAAMILILTFFVGILSESILSKIFLKNFLQYIGM